ncbi:hypothetical protein ABZ569_27635 [Streptomyces albus]|uniref:hypothetical protein n=1 Tax=Streptomyces albus TaxID=1888 RepID=UPI0033CCE637
MATEQRTHRPGTVWCGRILLLAALLLGLVTMHTLGHPEPQRTAAPAGHAAAAFHPATAAGLGTTDHGNAAIQDTAALGDTRQEGAAALGDTRQEGAAVQGTSAHEHTAHGDAGHGGPHHGTGMDPTSVCLAVLGVWSAAALLGAFVALILRRRAPHPWAPRRPRTWRVLWPLPPPSTASRLAQLSVLRI